MEILDQNIINDRLNVCLKCNNIKEFNVIYQEDLLIRHKCTLCGCTCENKVKYAIWKCPINRF